jgi:hypothetical protein
MSKYQMALLSLLAAAMWAGMAAFGPLEQPFQFRFPPVTIPADGSLPPLPGHLRRPSSGQASAEYAYAGSRITKGLASKKMAPLPSRAKLERKYVRS